MSEQSKSAAGRPASAPGRSSNQAKYDNANPVVRLLLSRFFRRLDSLLAPLGARSVLDAGCGEGEALERLSSSLPDRIAAVDIEQRCVDQVKVRHPGVEVLRQSVLDLSFPDAEFDVVLCLEVIEHLRDPEAAIAELARVSADRVVVSVPYEPYFRIGNLLRGNHLAQLGNHPEHVNHFSRKSIRGLVSGALQVERVIVSFPWLLVVARTRNGFL